MGKYLDIACKSLNNNTIITKSHCEISEISEIRLSPIATEEEVDKAAGNLITQEHFKRQFNCLADHLKRHHYTTEDITRLQELAYSMDEAWEAMDYPEFKTVIDAMLQIPSELKSEVVKQYAAKIYSKVLQDTAWVVTHPEAIGYVPEGEAYFLPEEIRNLKDAIPEEMQAVYKVKKELSGKLMSVNEIKEHTRN